MSWNNMKFISALFFLTSCGIYSFTGVSISKEVKTVQIIDLVNTAKLINPNLTYNIRIQMEDKFLGQTDLSLVRSDGDLVYEGRVTKYEVTTASSDKNLATQNRLTISIKMKFFNNFDKKQNFDREFTHFLDFDSNKTLQGSFETELVDEILEKLINDIYIASLANW